MPFFQASNARCDLPCDMRSYVTSNENVPRHFFALARFFVGMLRRRGVVSKRTQSAPRFGERGGFHRHREFHCSLMYQSTFYGLLRQTIRQAGSAFPLIFIFPAP